MTWKVLAIFFLIGSAPIFGCAATRQPVGGIVVDSTDRALEGVDIEIVRKGTEDKHGNKCQTHSKEDGRFECLYLDGEKFKKNREYQVDFYREKYKEVTLDFKYPFELEKLERVPMRLKIADDDTEPVNRVDSTYGESHSTRVGQ